MNPVVYYFDTLNSDALKYASVNKILYAYDFRA